MIQARWTVVSSKSAALVVAAHWNWSWFTLSWYRSRAEWVRNLLQSPSRCIPGIYGESIISKCLSFNKYNICKSHVFKKWVKFYFLFSLVSNLIIVDKLSSEFSLISGIALWWGIQRDRWRQKEDMENGNEGLYNCQKGRTRSWSEEETLLVIEFSVEKSRTNKIFQEEENGYGFRTTREEDDPTSLALKVQ